MPSPLMPSPLMPSPLMPSPLMPSPLMPSPLVPSLVPSPPVPPPIAMSPAYISVQQWFSVEIGQHEEGEGNGTLEQIIWQWLDEFRDTGAFAVTQVWVTRHAHSVTMRIHLYFKERARAEPVVELFTASKTKRQLVYVELIDHPSINMQAIKCADINLHYVTEVYACSKSLEEWNSLLAVAPPFSIFKNETCQYMLEHDLHPLNPVLSPQCVCPMAACTFMPMALEAQISVEEQEHGMDSVYLQIYDVAWLLINEDDSSEAEEDDVFQISAQADDDWVDVIQESHREDTNDDIGVLSPKHHKVLVPSDSVDKDQSGLGGMKLLARGPGGQGGQFSEAQLQGVEKHAAVFKAVITGLAQSWSCYPLTLYRIAGVAGTLIKRRGPNAWNSFQHQQKLAKRNPSGLGKGGRIVTEFLKPAYEELQKECGGPSSAASMTATIVMTGGDVAQQMAQSKAKLDSEVMC
ncbi:hypothetical protein BS47DRAFT_1361907 [Hydnum rufescens UP504]|uniref:Uncharacterized protein n=1 Tax=Hydnum rufescens UP504 TaxID=1448309 RepID=A0A9P6AZK3_9AGAM|nr:hypothetical protein BS47DRAFT_1361907 [Hydnum rufescens UP504]